MSIKNEPGTSKKYTFGFMDETGLLHSPLTDRVFALGLLKLQHPRLLHKSIIQFKNSKGFHNEFKFSDITSKNVKLYCGFIDLFFCVPNCYFSCEVFDKTLLNLKKFFNDDHVHAYNSYTAKLISESLSLGEYIAIIADDVSTPKDDNFEKQIKKKVRLKHKRNALFGIIRVESHAICELQMVDVLLGLVGYAYKLKYKLLKASNSKLSVLKHLQSKLKLTSFDNGNISVKQKGGCIFKINEFVPIK